MARKISKGIYSRHVSHGDSDSHDLNLLTRKSSRILIDDLPKFWGSSSGGKELLSLFLLYNERSFSFLSINASLAKDGTPAVIFESGEKVGCAPLYSPENGKACATIIVRGNMNEDISEILPLLEQNIDISFSDKLVLPFKSTIKPPIYFECAKYIDQYFKAQRIHWKKFISEERIESLPAASTQWSKYAQQSYDPNRALKYPNKKNLLSVNHSEWKEINYVLKMSLDELCSPQTPHVSKLAYKEKVEDLRRNADLSNISKPTELKIRTSDPLEIKTLKTIGNRIINSISSEYKAWCLDFSKLFECYVQYIFSLVARRIGGQTYCNNKFSISGAHKNWALSYLEPDILLRKGNQVIVADAKYKMHLMNSRSETVDALRESFRHDFHQVLAYSSFEKNDTKTSMLVYPCTSFIKHRQRIHSSIIATNNIVYLVGIPWGECKDGDSVLTTKQKIEEAVNGIIEIVLKAKE